MLVIYVLNLLVTINIQSQKIILKKPLKKHVNQFIN